MDRRFAFLFSLINGFYLLYFMNMSGLSVYMYVHGGQRRAGNKTPDPCRTNKGSQWLGHLPSPGSCSLHSLGVHVIIVLQSFSLQQLIRGIGVPQHSEMI